MIAFTGKSGSYNLAFMGEKKNNYKIELEECFYISDSDEITVELTEDQIEELQQIINKTVKEYTDNSEDGKYTDAYEFYGVSRSDF